MLNKNLECDPFSLFHSFTYIRTDGHIYFVFSDIDECAGGPCEHGGTCIDLVGGFRCECPPEWTGDVCQTDVDECESNPASKLGPCINANACHNTPGAFTCSCQEGWGGMTCAKDLDDCLGQCKQGTCIDLVNDYHCACSSGFTGKTNEIASGRQTVK